MWGPIYHKQGLGHINHARLCRVEPPFVPKDIPGDDTYGDEIYEIYDEIYGSKCSSELMVHILSILITKITLIPSLSIVATFNTRYTNKCTK